MKLLFSLFLISNVLFAMSAKPKVYQDYHIVGFDTTKELITKKMIVKALSKVGIKTINVQDMNTHFTKNNQRSSFKSYHSLTYIHKDISKKLVQNNPHMGLFYPSSMAIYQKKGDPFLWISFLSSRTHSKILKLTKREMLLAKLDQTILSALLPLAKRPRFYQIGSSLQRERKTLHHLSFTPKISTSALVQNLFEGLSKLGFDKPTPVNINKELATDEDRSTFKFYYGYLLSKPNLLYTLTELHPEVGAFLPMSLVVYQKKGEKSVHIIYQDVANIIDSSNILQTENLRALSKMQGALDTYIAKTVK